MSAVETFWNRVKDHPLSRVGPGLITGVADDDPSGIATYSQAGAQFGLKHALDHAVGVPADGCRSRKSYPRGLARSGRIIA